MSMAALPTAFIASDENKKGNIPPMKIPAMTFGSVRSMDVMPAVSLKAAKSARAVIAALAMAKPLPMAAVVLPTASNLSVRSRTIGSGVTSRRYRLHCQRLGRKRRLRAEYQSWRDIPSAAMATPYRPATA